MSVGLFALLLGAPMADQPTLLVAPIKAVGKVPAVSVAVLSEEVRTYAGKSQNYTLVTPEEMEAIDAELSRQLSGGCDEASCIAELGGALGAQYIITGALGRVGDRFTLNLKLIDIGTVTARNIVGRKARALEDLQDALPLLVAELLGDLRVGAGGPRQKRRAPLTMMETILVNATGATLVVGGVLFGVVWNDERRIDYALVADALVLSGLGVFTWGIMNRVP